MECSQVQVCKTDFTLLKVSEDNMYIENSNFRFVASFNSHTNWVRCTRPSPDGNQMVSCADDRTIKLWDLKSGDCIHTFYEPKVSIYFHLMCSLLKQIFSI